MIQKKLSALLLTLVLCLGLSVPALAAGPYTDVPPDYWAYDAIMRVSDDSKWPATFNGTSATTFSPEGNLTRGQFIAALNRSMNNEYWASLDGPAPYADVPESAYYYQAMIWAKQEGILPSWLINGKNIYPNTPLTRAEFCVILRNFDRWECGRSLDEMTDMYLDVFTDLDDATLGANAQDIRNAMLGWGYHLYVLNGTGDHTMSPNSPVTRAQAAVMLTRYWDTPKAKNQLFYDERRPDPGTPGASTAPWADEEEAGTEDPGTVTVPEETKPEETTPEETKPQTPEEADYIAEVILLVNQERAKEGLAALQTNDAITGAAQTRAEELPTLFDHTRPDGSSCFTALDEAGVRYWTAGENIAAGYATPAQVVAGWMNSPGHRANILNGSFTTIGVGREGNYWVQLFTA